MIDRLSSRVAAKPRNSAWIIFSLVVALALVLVVVLASAINLGSLFAPPYSSSDTPLTLTALGVCWTMDENIVVEKGGMEYANISFLWGHESESGFAAFGGKLANDTAQDALSAGSSVTVETRVGAIGGGVFGGDYVIVIHDILGDGWFNSGDTVTYMIIPSGEQLLPEDTEFNFALMYLGERMGIPLGEYSCAIHDGEFYTWMSDRLDWQRPWYDW